MREIAVALRGFPVSTIHRVLQQPDYEPTEPRQKFTLAPAPVALKIEPVEPLWRRALRERGSSRVADADVDSPAASLPVPAPGVLECASVPFADVVSAHGAKVRAGLARARGDRVGRPQNQKLTPDVVDRARAMLVGGMHLRGIAKDLGVPLSSLHRRIPGLATTTPEERREWARERSKRIQEVWANATPEERQRRIRAIEQGCRLAWFASPIMSPVLTTHEQRSRMSGETARRFWSSVTPQKRREHGRKISKAMRRSWMLRRARAMRAAGMCLSAVAAVLHVSQDTLRRAAPDLMATPEERKAILLKANARSADARRTMTSDKVERARAMLASGVRLGSVAAKLGVSKSSIHRALPGSAPPITREERSELGRRAGRASALARYGVESLQSEPKGEPVEPLWKQALKARRRPSTEGT